MTNAPGFPPIFATNDPVTKETVADAVNRLLGGLRTNLKNPPPISIATAYINPMGFALIADELEKVPRVRILLGAEPENDARIRDESGQKTVVNEALLHHDQVLRGQRDMLGFTQEVDAAAHRMVAWLRSLDPAQQPKVEVRRFTKGFLHGKAFIADHADFSGVLAGSANFTRAGMSWNRELVLGYPSGTRTDLVQKWFQDLWDQSETYDLASVYEERWLPHPPLHIFLRMLWELYGRHFQAAVDEQIELPATEFQIDGIQRALRILQELSGVLVCDEVGLGKTFIAGEIIRIASKRARQKVLVVVPASLKNSTWIPFLERYDLVSARVKVVTFDDVRIGTKPELRDLDEYSLVVIDEAHNLRNLATQRAEKVVELLRGEHPKQVVLMTATPVNNSLQDLYALISYFVLDDSKFLGKGIASIREYIKAAQRRDPDTLSPEHLFDLMDQVAVRRTRRFIKKHYAGDQILNNEGVKVPIVFPTPDLMRLDYDLGSEAGKVADLVFDAFAVSEDDDLVLDPSDAPVSGKLTLSRYAPSLYLKSGKEDQLQIRNVGLLRSAVLKRMESSTQALIVTLKKLIAAHEAFLEALKRGKVLIGDALNEYAKGGEFDELDELLASDPDLAEQSTDAKHYNVSALKNHTSHDLQVLQALLKAATGFHKKQIDDKVAVLLSRLEHNAKQATKGSTKSVTEEERRKVLVFSTYTDTVVDLHARVVEAVSKAKSSSPLADYKGRIAPPISGSRGGNEQQEKAETLAGFCPRTAGPLGDDGKPKSKDLYDILITTDVLSEGVNLQQAGRVINYDLPWNQMRLVQRHGRIDRIGSPHKRVDIGCFFPSDRFEQYLEMEQILQRKIAYANAAIGAGEVIPGQRANPNVEVVLDDSNKVIRQLHAGNPFIFMDGAGGAALSGEEYRRRLAKALRDEPLKEAVLRLPFGSGSGIVSQRARHRGYVFCVRMGEFHEPWFVFVPCDAVTGLPLVQADGTPLLEYDTLTCLMLADPGDSTVAQHIDNLGKDKVFDAWAVARTAMHREWALLADPKNLNPQLEKPLREAIQLVREGVAGLTADEQLDLERRLNGRWERSIVRRTREILNDAKATKVKKVQLLRDMAKQFGLQPRPPAKALPRVDVEDIQLVTWMSVIPASAENNE